MNELITVEETTALQAFSHQGGLDPIIQEARDVVHNFEHDLSTVTSRKRTASLAMKVRTLEYHLEALQPVINYVEKLREADPQFCEDAAKAIDNYFNSSCSEAELKTVIALKYDFEERLGIPIEGPDDPCLAVIQSLLLGCVNGAMVIAVQLVELTAWGQKTTKADHGKVKELIREQLRKMMERTKEPSIRQLLPIINKHFPEGEQYSKSRFGEFVSQVKEEPEFRGAWGSKRDPPACPK